MSHKQQPELKRRQLFAGAGAASAVAAATAVIPLVRQAEAPADEPKPAPERGGGYQLTQHVLRYYQTAKI